MFLHLGNKLIHVLAESEMKRLDTTLTHQAKQKETAKLNKRKQLA